MEQLPNAPLFALLFLLGPAAKVELVADDEQLPEAVSSSLFEKFDSRRIRETYEDFCREKQIEDVSMGLEYLSKIENRSCGN